VLHPALNSVADGCNAPIKQASEPYSQAFTDFSARQHIALSYFHRTVDPSLWFLQGFIKKL